MASQVFTTTGSQSWNWPAGVTSVVAEALGGGGGSGTASGNPATGGGGKGGSYAKVTITKGAEASLTIVVGTGGALAGAGAASTVVQGASTVLSAAGGAGGATQATSSANGAGGTTLNGANTGSTTFAGGNGGTGNFTSGTQGSGAGGGSAGPTSVGGAASVNVAGTAGTGTFGDGVVYSVAGRAGVGNSLPGVAGTNYGGGASGGKAVTGADQNGAVGGQGVVVLVWTPPNQSVTTLNITTTIAVNVPVVVQPLDITVAATVSTASARGSRAVVFPSQFIGYCFYVDSGGVFGYSKTTDGGDSWGAHVDVDGAAATTVVAFDIWFDQWTPGDSGTLIHCWWFDSTNNIVRWRTLNITGDTLGTVRTVFTGASAVAGRGAFVSGTKTRSGYLYCAYDIDAGTERGLHRSTDSGTTWSTNLATTFVEATLDTCKLFPASGTGDDNDCWALYYDQSATALTLKLWDSSAVAQVESATIGVAHTDGPTDLTGQYGYDAAVRHTDGHLIIATLSQRDVAASVHEVFDCTSTSTITAKTSIAASTDDHYFPQVFINQGTGTIFVAYNGKRDGSEVLDTTTKVYYTYSTNGGTTWNAGDAAYMQDAAGPVQQVWTPMSGSRFYVVWRSGTTLYGNKTNSLIQLGSQLPTIDATSVVSVPTIAPGPVAVVMATIATTAALALPTVSFPATPAQDVTGAFIGPLPLSGALLIDGLMSYWKLDESSGDALDSHGQITVTDMTTIGSATGKIGTARSFLDDRFEVAGSSPLALDLSIQNITIGYTFSCWFNVTDVADYRSIIAKRGGAVVGFGLEYLLRVNLDGSLGLYWGTTDGGAGGVATAAGSVALGTWHFGVGGYDAATGKFFVSLNGGSKIESAVVTNQVVVPTGGGQGFCFGGSSTSERFLGLIDEIGFWRRTLTATEIGLLYNSGAGLSYDLFSGKSTLRNNLQAYWNFGEASSTDPAADTHLNTAPLERVGSPAVVSGQIGTARQLVAEYFRSAYPAPRTLSLNYDTPFTWSTWVYLTDLSVGRPIICKFSIDPPYATPQTEYQLAVGATGLVVIVSNGGSTWGIVTGAIPTLNVWTHVVFWHDPVADTINIQINGGTPVSASWAGGTFSSVERMYVGMQTNVSSSYMAGRIDETAYWRRLLTSTERTALYGSGAGLAYDNFSIVVGSGGATAFPPTVVPAVLQTVAGAFIGGAGLSASLISYWKLDEASGSALDAHGTNHLIGINSPTSGAGLINTSRQFSAASSQYFTIASNASLDTGDIDFTISVWVKFLAGTAYRFLVTKDREDANREYGIYFSVSDSKIYFYVFNPSGTLTVVTDTSFTPTVGPWYHFIGWHDAVNDQIGIVINGGSVNLASHSGGVRTNTSAFSIGAIANANYPHDGWIDEVGFWKRLLTSGERTALYNGGAGLPYAAFAAGAATLFTPTVELADRTILGAFIGQSAFVNSLISYWPLDEASGTALDVHGTNPLTEVNGPVGSSTGIVGNCRTFGANTRRLEHADNTDLSTGDIDFTLSMWVYFFSHGNHQFFICKDQNDTPDREYGVYFDITVSKIQFYVVRPDGSGGAVNDPTSIVNGTWYHVVCWHDSVNDQLGLVLNGGIPNISSHTGGVRNSTYPLYLGLWGRGDFPHDGALDEVGFWKRVLTSDERAALYNGGAGLSYAAMTIGGASTFAPTVAISTTGPQTILGAFIPGPLGSMLASLAAYWAFDETGNTFAFDSHAGATLNYGGNPAAVSGKVGGARQINGSNYFQLMYPSNVPVTLGSDDPFTISVWVYLTDKSIDRYILAKATTGPVTATEQFEYWLHYNSSADRFAFIVGNGTTYGFVYGGGGSPALNTWHHIVCGHDPVANRLFAQVNGVDSGLNLWINGTQGSTNFLYFGYDISGNSEHWAGNIDETAFWRRVLTAGERTALYNNGTGLSYAAISAIGVRGVFPPTILPVFDQTIVGASIGGPSLLSSLVSYWSMEEAGGATALDAHGTNHLTDIGDFGLPGSATGKVGNARDFEASIYCMLTHSDNAALSTGDIDFTFSVWAKFETLSVGSEALIAKDNNGTDREYGLFYWWVDGRSPDLNPIIFWVFQPDGTAVSVTTAGFYPVIDTWYHFIGWHDAVNNQIAIVVNNGTPNVVSHSGGVKDGGADFTIGGWADGNLRVDGLIDEVGFWKRVLTSDERAYLYNSGSGRSYAALNTSLGGGAVVFSPTVAPVAPSAQAITGAFIGGGTLRTSLTSFWKLDETNASAPAFDAHGANTLTGYHNPGLATGKVGGARQFTAASAQYFSIPDNAAFSAGDRDFTVSAWFYFDSLSGVNYQVIFAKDAYFSAAGEFWFGWNPDDVRLSLGVRNASGVGGSTASVSTTPPINTWLHLVMWHDSVNNQVGWNYNGASAATFGKSDGFPDSTNPWTLGVWSDGTGLHNGRIDDVGFWARVLTPTERAALYNSGNGLSYEAFDAGATIYAPSVSRVSTQSVSGAFIGTGTLRNQLISHWRMDEGGGTALDAHGSNPLTVGGTESPGTTAGKIGTARTFVSYLSTFLTHADNADLSTGDIDFTLSVWVRITSFFSTAQLVAAKDDGTTDREYGLSLKTTDKFRFYAYTPGGTLTEIEATTISGGPWYLLVGQHDAANDLIKIIVNDGTVYTASHVGGVKNAAAPFTVGALGATGATERWRNSIDEISIWKRLLTSTEITALYNSGNGLSYDDFGGGTATFPPTITPSAPGDQAITTSFIASTAQVNVPTVTPGVVAVTTPGRVTTIQVFAPVVSANVAGATIPVGSGLFTPSVALNITTGTITTLIVVNVPSVAPGAVTVTTPGRTTTIQVFAPTVATGPVTVIGPTCAATSQLFGPTITTGAVTVTTPALATTAQLFTPLVTQGAVGIVGTTLASTLQIFAPSVAPGAITITGATLTSTAQVFAPRVAAMVFGATVTAGSGVFAPTLIQTVTTAFIATTAQLFTPTVVIFGVQAVTAGTVAVATVVNAPIITVAASAVSLPAIASTVQVFSPIVAPGVVTVTTPGCPTTQQLFAPTIATGPVTVIGATRATTTLVFPPSLTAQVTTAFLGSTTVLFPPVVLPTGVIGGPTTPSALQMFAPTVTTGAVAVTTGTIVSVSSVTPPSLTSIVTTPFLSPTLQMFGPTVHPGAIVVGGVTVGVTSAAFAPSVSAGVVVVFAAHVGGSGLVFAPVLTPGLTVGFITSTAEVFEPDVLAGATAVSTSFIASTTHVYPPAVGTVEVCEHFAVEIETALAWGVTVHTMEAVSLAAMTELDAGVQMDRQLDLAVNVETVADLTAPLQMCEAL